jgi:hypothetical protein
LQLYSFSLSRAAVNGDAVPGVDPVLQRGFELIEEADDAARSASRGFDSETGSASTAPGYGRSKRAWKNLR